MSLAAEPPQGYAHQRLHQADYASLYHAQSTATVIRQMSVQGEAIEQQGHELEELYSGHVKASGRHVSYMQHCSPGTRDFHFRIDSDVRVASASTREDSF